MDFAGLVSCSIIASMNELASNETSVSLDAITCSKIKFAFHVTRQHVLGKSCVRVI